MTVKLLGHRGAKGVLPENTLIGFEYIHNQQELWGVDGIEFDVQLTADKQLVVFHDTTLSRCVGRQGHISQLNADALSQYSQTKLARQYLSLPSLDSDMVSCLCADNIAIPKLSDLLPYLTSYRHIELELKLSHATSPRQFAQSILDWLDQQPLALVRQICLTSFDRRILYWLDNLQSYPDTRRHYQTGLLIETHGQVMSIETLTQIARGLGCCQIGIAHELLDFATIKHCHTAHLDVTAWTVNTVERMQQLIDWDVDAIISDYPNQFPYLMR